MQICRTVAELRAARARFGALGFAPTMGYLHEGHLGLARRAKAECGASLVSIFVNPTQFSAGEDLERYPRDETRDLALLAEEKTDLVFLPHVSDIYPEGFSSTVDPGPLAHVLEGASRPGHFVGVATVVAKLLNMAQPTKAYFGQKDAQQCLVIRRVARDLDLPVEIVIQPTARDGDGLALSSRNAYLSKAERAAAPVLFRALQAVQARVVEGERDADRLRQMMQAMIMAEPLAELDYVSLADAETLSELARLDRPALASVAVRFGATRLIDNLVLQPSAA